eukprot:g2346.t1
MVFFRHFASKARSFSTRAAANVVNARYAGAGAALAVGVTVYFCADSLARTEGQDFYPEGYRSIFDRVSDLQVQLSGKTNQAFVFIKPHAAASEATKKMVRDHLKANEVRITAEGTLDAATIDAEMLIDSHYGSIASKAMTIDPKDLVVPQKGQDGFEEMMGESWSSALEQGKVLNAKQACEKLGFNGESLEKEIRKCTRGKDMIKFGGGFYCSKVGDYYVINGFYMSMRSAYTEPGTNGIHWFTVQWPTDTLSWESFRGEVLGATNPQEAADGSLRRKIFESWESLGLPSQPNTGDNGVHASASPFEGLAERNNWLGTAIEDDSFGKGLLAAGISKDTITGWFQDPQVKCADENGSLFDFFEDLDADSVLEKAKKIE